MYNIKVFFAAIALFISNSGNSQTLLKSITNYPAFAVVVDSFYNNYGPEAGTDMQAVFNFARTPKGWFVVRNSIINDSVVSEELFWSMSTGFNRLKSFSILKDAHLKADFPYYQNKEYVFNYHTERMYRLHTYYGYNGWADDVIKALEPIEASLGIEDLYSLGRAYSAKASALVQHNDRATLEKPFTFNPNGNSLTNQELTYYLSLNAKARNCFKIIADRNPSFYDIVGKIQTKYANEVMQAYMDLYVFQNEEIARKQLLPAIYSEEILTNARNYLFNCPKDAIFISFGDNDTYPLWYVQVTESYRTDVIVINYSLLGLRQYVDALRRGMNGNQIKFSINQTVYNQLELVSNDKGDYDLDEKKFIEWMNNPMHLSDRMTDFPGVYVSCRDNGIAGFQEIYKDYLVKHEIALLDLYISNKNRSFCSAYSSEPMDIFGDVFNLRGMVYELDICSGETLNLDTVIYFFEHMQQDAYRNKSNYPFKPGTAEFIDDVVISNYYQNLLKALNVALERGDEISFEKLKAIWSNCEQQWAVPPNKDMTSFYNENYKNASAVAPPTIGPND